MTVMRTIALAADGVSVSIDGRRILNAIDLAIPSDAWTAIVGPNGAGKSTLLSVMAGLMRADSGRILLEGRPLEQFTRADRARRIAWLGQQSSVEAGQRVDDVVMLGRLPHIGLFGKPTEADRRAIQAALEMTGCEPLRHRRLDSLSGGERRRVLIARAMAGCARVLLLDEPGAHLDAPHQRQLMKAIRDQARSGLAIVSVVHDLNRALSADQVAVLANGRLGACGPVSDPRVRAAIIEAFSGAIGIERSADDSRWIALEHD